MLCETPGKMTLEIHLYELTASLHCCMLGKDQMNGNSGKLFKILLPKMY